MERLNMTDQVPLPDWDRIEFGLYPTDYIFVAQTNDQHHWEEGELRRFYALREGQPHLLHGLALHPAAAILNYGQAAFEGLRAVRTAAEKILLFRPDENARRFERSAARLEMPTYPVDQFLHAVEQVVQANARFVPPHDKGSLYIRPVMIGSGPVLGVGPAPSYHFYIFVSPVGVYMRDKNKPKDRPNETRLIVLDATHRAPSHGIGDIKASANYASTLRPHRIAADQGYTDALYLDARQDRFIEELGSSNFFAILQDGTLVTPNLGSILPGITRDSVIKIAQEILGWAVEERQLTIEEVLTQAHEAFFTGTAAIAQSVIAINYQGQEYPIGTGKLGAHTEELYRRLVRIQTQQDVDPFGWVHEVAL